MGIRMRWAHPVLIAAGLGLAQPAVADMSGHWLHAGDPMGLVVSFLEELVIPADSGGDPDEMPFEIRVHRLEYLHNPMCLDGSAPPESCTAAVVTDRGRLRLDPAGKQLTVLEAEALAVPFIDTVDVLGWPMVGLAPVGQWTIAEGEGSFTLGRLILETHVPVELMEMRGDQLRAILPITQKKRYFRVPDGFAADLLTVTGELGNAPIVLSGCVVEVLATRPDLLSEVAAQAAHAAPVIREVRAPKAALSGMAPGIADLLFETVILPFRDQIDDPEAAIIAPSALAPEAWEAAVLLARFHRQEPDAELVLFPQAVPHVDAIADCGERLFDEVP
jgi:hypothetical protein